MLTSPEPPPLTDAMSGMQTLFVLLPVLWLALIPEPGWAQENEHAREIRLLGERTEVRRAFRAIEAMQPSARADLIELTEIPAPPFHEENRARRYAEMLQSSGADTVWIDEEGNVLGLRRGVTGGRTVALDGHLDTVFPEGTDVTVTERGDTLFAPGIGDDTQGLVLVLTILRAIERAEIATEADLLFTGTVGEEGLGDLRGVKHLFRDGGPRIDSWIAVDGGGVERIAHQALGSHRYRITYRGPGGHSWGAFGLANPHHALGSAIDRFVAAADSFTSSGPRTSYNVGRIGGGTSVNSIPFEAWMEVDMRSVSLERLVGIDSLFQRSVRFGLESQNRIRRLGEPLTAEVDMIGDRPSGSIDPSTPIVQRAIAATRYLGAEPRLGTGSTNSNIPISRSIPAVTIGKGGRGGGAHSLGEWLVLKDADLAAKKALLILLAEAGISR